MKTIIVSMLVALLTACGGGSTADTIVVKDPNKPVHVAVFGDSLTAQSNTSLLTHLPNGSTMIPDGVHGATAMDALNGWYQESFSSRLSRTPKHYCVVISYGTNEQNQLLGTGYFMQGINGLIAETRAQGFKCIVLEGGAPMRVEMLKDQINALKATGLPVSAVYDYYLPDGVHPGGDGYHKRAVALAAVLKAQ